MFNLNKGLADEKIELPCGQCIGCRLENSRQWALRALHEAAMHENNCFITLTYDEEHLPEDGSLDKTELQRFFKRYRKAIEGNGQKIRYLACGEYGENLFRPHYHAVVFGHDFTDRELFSVRDDINIYQSQLLADLWGLGYCTVGDVTFESAAYVARYVTKKLTGDQAEGHYLQRNRVTGEIGSVHPEFRLASRRPGLGADWYEKWSTDVFPSDTVVLRGRELRPPAYYTDKFQIDDPSGYEKLKEKRRKAVTSNDDYTLRRLRDREKVKLAQYGQLKRGYENAS